MYYTETAEFGYTVSDAAISVTTLLLGVPTLTILAMTAINYVTSGALIA